jgi:cytochrome c heme-lyase
VPILLFSSDLVGMGSKQSKDSASMAMSTKREACPVRAAPQKTADACPVREKQAPRYKNKDQYNVYNQKLDPTNQMPSNANQMRSPGQSEDLPTERVRSTIPKGGTDNDTWQYPSPQMFWNALVRKNKTEGASEKDIVDVVAVHNNMNEKTWKQVLVWENLLDNKYEPTLLRFLGRPDELSPRARLKMIFGHPEPFDRHDWYIDRGGEEVRYIIDYYHDESNIGNDKKPKNMHDATSMKSIKVEVRPALDSLGALLHRAVKMPLAMFTGDPRLKLLAEVPFFAPKIMLRAEGRREEEISRQWKDIRTKCASFKDALATCKGDDECGAASVSLQKCTSSVICPDVALAFDRSVKAGKNEEIEAAYIGVTKCLELFSIDSKKVLGKD